MGQMRVETVFSLCDRVERVKRAALFLFCPAILFCADLKFSPHVIASDLNDGYQVVAADLNGDGKPDLIALGEQMTELVWYENPSWQRHVIVSGVHHTINCATLDLDGDNIPEIALASGFTMNPKTSVGSVVLLHHDGDPRRPWRIAREIDKLPTSHRLRWADMFGDGHRVLINAPLAGMGAIGPEYGAHVPVVFYRPGEWKRTLISDANEGVQHAVTPVFWNDSKKQALLTASFSGIDLLQAGPNEKWTRTEISKGNPAPWPKCGSSEAVLGHLRGTRYIASIEPWHGNQVVVYLPKGNTWVRNVIDNSFIDGHTLWTADFDGDGQDDMVAGYRGPGHSVYVYRAKDPNGRECHRYGVDNGGIKAAACAIADLNGDGRSDIACIGGNQLKWYANESGGNVR